MSDSVSRDAVPSDSMPLFDVKNHLSRVVEDVRTTHRRVVITNRGRPAAVLISADDLASLEATLEPCPMWERWLTSAPAALTPGKS